MREIGCSFFTAPELGAAREAAGGGAKFACVQNEYSLLHREPEDGLLAECERQRLAFLPYYPLASGVLTGKYRRGARAPQGTRLATNADWAGRFLTERHLAVAEALAAFAAAPGPRAAGAGGLVAAEPAGGGVGHRRRLEPRASARQRGRR